MSQRLRPSQQSPNFVPEQRNSSFPERTLKIFAGHRPGHDRTLIRATVELCWSLSLISSSAAQVQAQQLVEALSGLSLGIAGIFSVNHRLVCIGKLERRKSLKLSPATLKALASAIESREDSRHCLQVWVLFFSSTFFPLTSSSKVSFKRSLFFFLSTSTRSIKNRLLEDPTGQN